MGVGSWTVWIILLFHPVRKEFTGFPPIVAYFIFSMKCNVSVFNVVDRDGNKIRDEKVINYIQKVILYQ